MNRKETQEQNDISIIIGNLPKRLQKKISDEIGGVSVPNNNQKSSVEHGDTSRQMLPTGRNNGWVSSGKSTEEYASGTKLCERLDASSIVACARDVPRIDLFLKMSAKSNGVLTPAEKALPVEVRHAATTSSIDATTDVAKQQAAVIHQVPDASLAIPGILRLSVTNAVQLKTNDGETSAVRENGRKQLRPLRGDLSTKGDLPSSPAHQLHKDSGRPEWFDNLAPSYVQDLKQLHDKFLTLIQEKSVVEHWPTFHATRLQLQSIFTQLLLHHLKFCCEQKVDNFFWRQLFYNVRVYLKQQKPTQTVSNCTLSLLDDGLQFYTELHALLTAKYLRDTTTTTDAEMQPAINGEIIAQRTAHKFKFIAKVAAQKLLICLGDLCRYKAKHLATNDFSAAAQYYRQAQLLIPTNGIPYNQLAIVAIHDRKKFDAIYYHMRSLMSSNAIYSAKESLLVLFDEIRKKFEETELKTSPVHQNTSNNSSKSMRKEVWVYPDEVRRLQRTNKNVTKARPSEENRLNACTNDDVKDFKLSSRLMTSLLAPLSMESIQEHQNKLLVHLNCALKRNPLVLTRARLLKMVALNIFILHQNMHRDSRREMRYHAFNFCNQFFGLVLRKCNQHLTVYLANTQETAQHSFSDLNTMLQYIKVYTDFLAQNVHIWEPIRNEEHAFIDCWSELQHLFPLLKHIAMQNADVSLKESHVAVSLEEDIFFVGFVALASASKNHTPTASSNELAQFHRRVTEISHFRRCFEEQRHRVELNEDQHFMLEQWHVAVSNVLHDLESHDDDNCENIIGNGNGSSEKPELADDQKLTSATRTENAQISQVSQLTKLKKELEAKTNVKKMYNAKFEEILKYVDTKVYLEVRPKYLMPDTNVFIDCLEDFERLATEYKRYTLIIPLTVVKELDGLSKGVKLEAYEKSLQKHRIHHFDDVSTRAKKSLDFIRTSKNNVKCATTKGSIINASLFALVEEEHVSNDDKILATALALSKTLSTETSKDGKCLIQTELVLITTDRNLRVKALSRNLAVSELSEFLQWANECSDI